MIIKMRNSDSKKKDSEFLMYAKFHSAKEKEEKAQQSIRSMKNVRGQQKRFEVVKKIHSVWPLFG